MSNANTIPPASAAGLAKDAYDFIDKEIDINKAIDAINR